jgi:crossover junction endodeoxyribonuclease RuvC
MSIILGIDPGSRITGYGVLERSGQKIRYIDSGCIRLKSDDLSIRLGQIFVDISEIVQQYKPTEGGIEQVFVHQNPGAALKLGQARGAAIVAMRVGGLTVSEYSARQVKLAVVGYGGAEKIQVQQMVVRLLQLSKVPQADAADALAIALCHAHTR